MSDGADLNMAAEGSLKAVLGGGEPERMTDAEFEQMIRTATEAGTYGDTANYTARLVLEFLEAHPEHRETPIESEGEFQIDGRKATTEELREHGFEGTAYVVSREGLYDVMKASGAIPPDGLGLTGFMWGWAFNAAHKVLGLDAQPNPAIVQVGCGDKSMTKEEDRS